jgi:hypothetical protein
VIVRPEGSGHDARRLFPSFIGKRLAMYRRFFLFVLLAPIFAWAQSLPIPIPIPIPIPSASPIDSVALYIIPTDGISENDT